eukprot:TRINITY_DN7308_c0_g1_i1.p1 TRINITY_DN7308_c0_g1~~TRINITY_DN7308_c0_g1_i1.p1  ORF type:complete len:386 (+),score=67.16 TRINITY_DN7308_c0_g1_i1:159-1160(+)
MNKQHYHQYRNRFGETDFLEAIQQLLKNHYKCEVSVANILACAGVTGAIVASLMMLKTENKTKIGLIEPFYTYHAKQVQAVLGVAPEFIKSNPDFSLNFDNIENSLKAGCNCIIMCNPGNPSGRVTPQEELNKLEDLVVKYDSLLLIDEIYCDMVFTGRHTSPLNRGVPNDHVIVCRGFSKTLGIQSWRLGYVVASESNIKQLMAMHDPIYISVSWQQHCVADYLQNHYDDFAAHIATINNMLQSNWKLLRPAFQEALSWDPIEPSGSMYGMFKHNGTSDIAALRKGLQYGVGVAPASMFFGGNPENTGFIRIHVGMSPENAAEIAQILRAKK